MIRWLLLLCVVWIGYRLLRGLFQARPAKQPPPKNLQAGEMVPCKGCGTYVVRESAVMKKGQLYCSEECIHQEPS